MLGELVEHGKLGTKSGEGFFQYIDMFVSKKLNERDRNFIKLGKMKAEVIPQQAKV
jgi:3-hydroxybutyryl-CoA dehydrogenase